LESAGFGAVEGGEGRAGAAAVALGAAGGGATDNVDGAGRGADEGGTNVT